jgi:hypothetical protein
MRPGIYERPDSFVPVFEGSRSLDDLMETKLSDAGAVTSLPIEKMSVPHRSVDADNVRAVLAAAELHESCAIAYMMTDKKVVFIAFAIEDERLRDFLKGQSLNTATSFEFIDMSVKEAYDKDWKDKVQSAWIMCARGQVRDRGAIGWSRSRQG